MKVTKFGGEGGFMIAGAYNHGVYVTPRNAEKTRFTVQAGVGLCDVSRDDLLALGRAMVELAERTQRVDDAVDARNANRALEGGKR